MNTRKAVVGAAAVLAAGVGGVATASTVTAQPQSSERITSIEQLKTHLHHAVVIEAQNTSAISCCPAGEAIDQASV
ncbi:MAG TPA: hypothetical protein VGB75_03985 [Jatrophihabitans sp.]|jgi:hypothetical protein|uniref:hypothetical protein n=1 Tax=Jatrophihabitans sp. TaxID=1932789 RepID=UPI002EE40D48